MRRRAALRRDSRDAGDGLTGGLARGPPTLIPGRRAPPRPPQNLAAVSPVAVAGARAEPVCPPRRAVRFRCGVARSYGARERSAAATSGFAPRRVRGPAAAAPPGAGRPGRRRSMFKRKLWAVLAASAPSLGWRGGKRGEEVKPAAPGQRGYAGPVPPAAGLRGGDG